MHEGKSDLIAHTARIVAGYVSRNEVDDLPGLMRRVFDALASLSEESGAVNSNRLQPAVPVRQSIMPEYLVCLEDGKKLKMLKRHLKAAYGLTPEQYRNKWNLPADYPMTAPNYAEKRSRLAKQSGLGTNGKK